MFESPMKSTNAWSESQEELHETQPVSPIKAGNVGKKKKKRRRKQQQQQQPKRHSVPAPLFCTEDTSQRAADRPEEKRVDSDKAIVRGIFQIDKKSHDVVLTPSRVTWAPIEPETPTAQPGSVPREGGVALREVFAVKVKRRRSAGQRTGGTMLGITLFCCRRKGLKLRDQPVHLNNMSVDHCEVWFRHLKELLSGFRSRPKSLKVFVNPSSHRKEACQVYRDQVAPLFHLADIKTHVTITERKGHAFSILQECNLDEYDGVVCVGGDGSVAEVAHGLLLRGQMEAGRDTDSMFTPVRAALPLGLIPAGSTDIVACSVHGIRHPVTAAMHIIMGHLQAVDVCSFSSPGRGLLRFGFGAMFGFGGRALALAEKHRWMPPAQRREFALIKTLANLRPQDCELSFLPVKSAQGEETRDQKKKSLKEESDTEEEGEWKTIHGLYLNVSIMAIPCVCSMAPHGLAPNTRLANGSMALIAAGNTSRSEFIKHLKRYSSVTNQFSFSFVQTHTVQAVRLRPRSTAGWTEEASAENEEESDSKTAPIISSEETRPWNIDGDLLDVPGELLVRVHPQLLTLFGEEVEEADDSPIKCSCI